MYCITANVNVSSYDLKGIISIIKHTPKIESTFKASLLTIAKNLPEKLIISFINNKLVRKTMIPKVLSAVNKLLSAKGADIVAEALELEKTSGQALDISMRLKFESYSSFIDIIKDNVKIKNNDLKVIVDTAAETAISDIPDDIKNTLITKIVNKTSPEICRLVCGALKKNDIPAEIDNININITSEF